jgi:anti-anti-sigma factor
MNALLICPGPRPAVALLAEAAPLATAPILGKNLLEYWIEYLQQRGVRELHILAADRAGEIATAVGDGTRWGVQLRVEPELRESLPEEAVAAYCATGQARPDFVVALDHLPGRPLHRLLESYAGWFDELQAWIPMVQSPERIGQCEIEPGVWVGLRTRINSSVRFMAPCWLGDQVLINGDAVIGPGAIIEPAAIVGQGAHVSRSVIGPATFVGAQTRIENSLAHRFTLINWASNSCLRVPDACWLSSLRGPLSAHRPAPPLDPIKVQFEVNKLQIVDLGELSAANASPFMEAIRESLTTGVTVIEVDLAHTRFMDSCGLATLCSLLRITSALGIRLRLLHPRPPLRQLLELTQLADLFEIYGPTHVAAVTRSSRAPHPAGMIRPEPPDGLVF